MKKFKSIATKLGIGLGAAVVAVGLFLLFNKAVEKNEELLCTALTINIDDNNGNYFVTESNIIETIISTRNDTLVGSKIASIDFDFIEHKIEENDFISSAEIFANTRGEVTINVVNKRPILRIINKHGVSFYIDADGTKLPLNSNFTSRVSVCTGNVESIGSGESETVDQGIIEIAKFLDKNEFWFAQIEQIFVADNGEIYLSPKVGSHKILLGDSKGLEEKMARLKTFYVEGLNQVGWGQYEVLNLKYKDQVVCKKKNTEV